MFNKSFQIQNYYFILDRVRKRSWQKKVIFRSPLQPVWSANWHIQYLFVNINDRNWSITRKKNNKIFCYDYCLSRSFCKHTFTQSLTFAYSLALFWSGWFWFIIPFIMNFLLLSSIAIIMNHLISFSPFSLLIPKRVFVYFSTRDKNIPPCTLPICCNRWHIFICFKFKKELHNGTKVD